MEQNTSFIVQFKCGAREEEQTIRKKIINVFTPQKQCKRFAGNLQMFNFFK